ncbi:hypothetical protein, partial [Aeromonas hydrophila]|uniref:hypothetical protein n=1 Tax=Aeromonas hydrophila TaxID=644 RepID=UPI003F66724B
MSDFESFFSISCGKNIKGVKKRFFIVEGEKPYKQSLNSISFTVSVNPTNTRVSHHYGAYNEIAFVVSDWIKIQDSL